MGAAYAPISVTSRICMATDANSGDRIWTCLAEPNHALDHAAYGASNTVPDHTWPQEAPSLDREQITRILPAALADRARLCRTVARSRALRGPENAGARVSVRAEADMCERLSSLLGNTIAGEMLADAIADALKTTTL
jgi:hypothetical protein